MTLYSGTTDPYSHRCRIVLFEKGMDFQVIDVDLANKPEDLAVINPYNQVPVLVERDLVLSEANIINEYIDERFPHPQLMPPDPVMRARARMQRAALVRPVRQVIDVDPYLPQPELASLVDLQQDTAGKPMLGTPPVELGSLPHEAVSVAPASASAAQVMPDARVYTPLHRVSFCARASVSPHAAIITTVLSL